MCMLVQSVGLVTMVRSEKLQHGGSASLGFNAVVEAGRHSIAISTMLVKNGSGVLAGWR